MLAYHNLNQEIAKEFGLDYNDVAILDWFVYFAFSKTTYKLMEGQDMYVWIKYSKLLEDRPLLDINEVRLGRRLKSLCEKGILKSKKVYEKDGVKGTFMFYCEGDNFNKLYNFDDKGVVSKVNGGLSQKSTGGCLKSQHKDNTIQDKTIYIDNVKSTKKQEDKNEIAKKVIQYLNEKLNKNFNTNIKTNITPIVAILNLGYSYDDCIKVIDNKILSWANDEKMKNYLRIQTLFRQSHFDSYLNETPSKNKKTNYTERDNSYDNIEKQKSKGGVFGWN